MREKGKSFDLPRCLCDGCQTPLPAWAKVQLCPLCFQSASFWLHGRMVGAMRCKEHGGMWSPQEVTE